LRTVLRVAPPQQLDAVLRLGFGRLKDAAHAVGTDPPERRPVLVVVVVDQQGDVRVGPYVGQPAQRGRPLGLVVDRDVDGVRLDGEDDGYRWRASAPVIVGT
jgi:hypothetical protein